jgi:hypothetical protein
MLVEREYQVLLNQKIQATEDIIHPQAARAAVLKPGYALSAFPKAALFMGGAYEVVYYPKDARLAEQDLAEQLNAAENFVEIEELDVTERQAGVECAAIHLMVKANAYRTLYMSNTQNLDVHKEAAQMTTKGLAKNIATAISFSKNLLPEEKYAKLDKALVSSFTMTHAN